MPAFIVNGKVICSLLSAGEKVNKNRSIIVNVKTYFAFT